MSFKTTLFNLLKSDALIITVDCVKIESVQDYGVDANAAPVLRCESGDQDWYFADQEVFVHVDGTCSAKTAPGDWDTGNEPFVATLEFLVTRPILESDLTS